MGGTIINERLGGNLLVTRALGDFDMKKFGLIGEPDIKEYTISTNLFIAIASDGIWDTIGS